MQAHLTTQIQVHALHKSGSMFLHKFFKTLASLGGLNFFSINEIPPTEAFANDCDSDFIVAPIRWYPDALDPKRLYVFVVRNPLDVLVSQYYSHGWMHSLPYDNPSAMDSFKQRRKSIQKLTIDEYTLKYSTELLQRYANLLNYWDQNNVLVALYSEMVCDFKSWCHRICKGLVLDETQEKTMYDMYHHEFASIMELTPNEIFRGQRRHVRKMLPDDHLEKLSATTIKCLNMKFDAVLKLLHRITKKQDMYDILLTEQTPVADVIPVADVSTVSELPSAVTDDLEILRLGTNYGEWYIPHIELSETAVFTSSTQHLEQ